MIKRNDTIEYIKKSELKPHPRNPRAHNNEQLEILKRSIDKYTFTTPCEIDENNVLLAGHGRVQSIADDSTLIPCLRITGMSEKEKLSYLVVANKSYEAGDWFEDELAQIAKELEDELNAFDFDFPEIEQDTTHTDDELNAVPEVNTSRVKLGEVWKCGKHRVMCGDSTSSSDVGILMGGEKAVLGFFDPPYGMKKEKEGVLNDNLNYKDLLEFNKKWIAISFDVIDEVGSWYCWGIDEPLMDIYSHIIKPMISEQKATFRNLLTWDKGSGQGQLSEGFRMFPVADEKCLFVMAGVQGFNTNSDNYFEGWEPVRDYLLKSRISMGWDVPTMKKIVGHSDLNRDHWTNKSQFNMPTREVYNKLRNEAQAQRVKNSEDNDAFTKEYDELKKEYDELKKEYDELKKEYYSTRAYFNNLHDNMNNVWHFSRTETSERNLAGGHATPKPVKLVSRAIMSSSKEGDLVLDLFLGSGTTLVASNELGRTCYGMELDPIYCEVILKRYETLTGDKAVRCE